MRFVLDEMLPPAAAPRLRAKGHDAVSVSEIGLRGAPDLDVYRMAVVEDRIVVTENFADYAAILDRCRQRGERAVPVVFVRRSSLRSGGRMATDLTRRLDKWADTHPEPFIGLHRA